MEQNGYEFDFERLNVYQKALDFTNEIFTITLNFRRKIQYSLGDQFRRAALSICNNLAEGSRKSAKGRKQFYDYALDSARECVPMISLSIKQKHCSLTGLFFSKYIMKASITTFLPSRKGSIDFLCSLFCSRKVNKPNRPNQSRNTKSGL